MIARKRADGKTAISPSVLNPNMELGSMPESIDSHDTTDPSAPTTSEMDAMWLALRRAEEDAADRRSYERFRRSVNVTVYGHILAEAA
jgi:hypothetical protein